MFNEIVLLETVPEFRGSAGILRAAWLEPQPPVIEGSRDGAGVADNARTRDGIRGSIAMPQVAASGFVTNATLPHNGFGLVVPEMVALATEAQSLRVLPDSTSRFDRVFAELDDTSGVTSRR
jgi:hypothetical protein